MAIKIKLHVINFGWITNIRLLKGSEVEDIFIQDETIYIMLCSKFYCLEIYTRIMKNYRKREVTGGITQVGVNVLVMVYFLSWVLDIMYYAFKNSAWSWKFFNDNFIEKKFEDLSRLAVNLSSHEILKWTWVTEKSNKIMEMLFWFLSQNWRLKVFSLCFYLNHSTMCFYEVG